MNEVNAKNISGVLYSALVVVMQFELTPKALANFSPGLELATTLVSNHTNRSTLKGFRGWRTLSGFEPL
jgi:hypothetical protein